MAAHAQRFSTLTMSREAITIGFDASDGFLGRTRGHDIAWPDPETFDPTRFIGTPPRTGRARHTCRSAADDGSASGRASP
jgi:hypothetical protein